MVDIVLDGPGKNALSTELMTDVIDALDDAGGAPVLLTGAGDAFSAGLNLKEIVSLDEDGMRDYLLLLEDLVESLYTYPGPTVALLNGHAIAGGCVLSLCCDYRVATSAPRTRIGLNEVAIGVRFPPVTFRVVQRRIPRRHQERVLLGGQLYGPKRALHLGLIDEIADDPEATARERLELFGGHSKEAYAATKADIRGSVGATPEEQRAFAEDVMPVWTSTRLRRALMEHLKR